MGNRIFLSVVVAAAAALFYSTFFFKKSLIGASSSPEGMPRFVLTGIIVVGLLLLARDWKKGLSAHVRELFQGTRLYVVVALPVYLLALPWLGFSLSTFLLLLALFTLLAENRPDAKRLALNALLAALLAGTVFFLFRQVFHIQLPTLWLGF